jgi:hypothetical protein
MTSLSLTDKLLKINDVIERDGHASILRLTAMKKWLAVNKERP